MLYQDQDITIEQYELLPGLCRVTYDYEGNKRLITTVVKASDLMSRVRARVARMTAERGTSGKGSNFAGASLPRIRPLDEAALDHDTIRNTPEYAAACRSRDRRRAVLGTGLIRRPDGVPEDLDPAQVAAAGRRFRAQAAVILGDPEAAGLDTEAEIPEVRPWLN